MRRRISVLIAFLLAQSLLTEASGKRSLPVATVPVVQEISRPWLGSFETNQADIDKETIRQVLQHYVDVTDKKDAESIKLAFHPDAKLMSTGSSGLKQLSLAEWWERVSRIPGKVERKSRITVIDVTGLAAVAKVDFDRSTDYMTLLKIKGEWKIVNKVLSTSL